jgi:hypothetical protein
MTIVLGAFFELTTHPASACDGRGLAEHALDPDAEANDHVAPTLPAPTLVRINRGRDEGGACGAGSCDGSGAIWIGVAAADDATPADRMGYRLAVMAGSPPHGFTVPMKPVRAFGGSNGQLWLEWDDGASDDQEAFSFTLQIVAIDLAGNESVPQTLMIADGGSGGCRIAGRAPPIGAGTIAVLVAVLLMMARRSKARRRVHGTLLAMLALGALAPRPARACSFGDTPHMLDPAAQTTDHVAPALAKPRLGRITRGQAGHGCSGTGTSCDDIGSINVVVAATDDATPAEKIGFRLSVVDGSPPHGLQLPAGAIRGYDDGIWLRWVDGMSDEQEPFLFMLQVVAIDLAGNESAPVAVVVSDSGSGGCRIAGRAPPLAPGTVAGLLGALFVIARRRRRTV